MFQILAMAQACNKIGNYIYKKQLMLGYSLYSTICLFIYLLF